MESPARLIAPYRYKSDTQEHRCEAEAKEYQEHPENFIGLDDFIAGEQAKKVVAI
jgi:hypothetical protein